MSEHLYMFDFDFFFLTHRRLTAFLFFPSHSALLFLVSLSDLGILAAAIGGACGAILIILGLVVAVRLYRKRQKEDDIELPPHEYTKTDPTLW